MKKACTFCKFNRESWAFDCTLTNGRCESGKHFPDYENCNIYETGFKNRKENELMRARIKLDRMEIMRLLAGETFKVQMNGLLGDNITSIIIEMQEEKDEKDEIKEG